MMHPPVYEGLGAAAGMGQTVRDPEYTDPLTGEDTSRDHRFEIKWVFAINPPKEIQSDANDTGGRK